ncbi:MAG TPA: glycosyltransferase [Acetobacteraceae bacterium]|nr:glycosyltransferase [Acetobacteraceae bacterium]
MSILVPVHNQVALTRACLDSLRAHEDPNITAEIIIIDDCSTDGTKAFLGSLGSRVRVHSNQARGTFGINMNLAARLAGGDFVVLLNNDTEVTPGWLNRMLEAMRSDEAIGLVGNRHLYPDSRLINHAGMAFDATGYPVHLYLGRPPDYAPAQVSREFQILNGACWLVRRELFLELGGFDTGYRNGWEDIDFCLRVRERGSKVWYAADSVIYHHVSASAGRFKDEGDNARYFATKWQGRFAHDLQGYLLRDGEVASPGPINTPPAAPAAPSGSADLHFAVPLQHGNGFSWVTARLALACEAAGLRVSLSAGPIDASIEGVDRNHLQRMMDRGTSPRAQVKWSHYREPHWGQELSARVNAELFCTNYRYGPQPLHRLDQWMRHAVMNAHRKLPTSQYCMDALTELGVPASRCRLVPYGYSPEVLEDTGADDRFRGHGFVFLALTNGYDPYRYGTDILLQAFRRAFRDRHDVVLVLRDSGGQAAGPLRRWLREMANAPRVIHHSQSLSKRALIRLYRGADALVAPFRGAGFGVNVLDACATGLPVLAPQYGGPADYLSPGEFVPLDFTEVPVGECLNRAETIVPEFARWAEVVADDLAVRMRDVAADCDATRQGAARARERVLRDFSWQRAASLLTAAIEDFEQQREAMISTRFAATRTEKALSVIIPTSNRPAQLGQVLEGYNRQTLPSDQWEIVLSDAGSDYDVGGLVEVSAPRLDIRVISDASSGPEKARNRAIPRARGEIALFTSDDIVPRPDFLANHLARHRQSDNANLAVLGFTEWHRDVQVTRLMRYITGDGGQLFAYRGMRPGSIVPYTHFYTSNVSLPISLLRRQEELFSDRFAEGALEDSELSLRLAWDGMTLLYAPEAIAAQIHAMTDDEIHRRQYDVGRSLVRFAMLHPQRIDPDKQGRALRLLDVFQHVLAEQPAFQSRQNAISEAGSALEASLHAMAHVAGALEVVGPSMALQPDWSARLFGAEVARMSDVTQRLYAVRLDLAELDGIADEWLGIAQGVPNPARDFLRSCFVTERLLQTSPAGQVAVSDRELPRLYRLARDVRRHPLLQERMDRLFRNPAALSVIKRAARLLGRPP